MIVMEEIPRVVFKWREASNEDYIKHDLILQNSKGVEYCMGCVIRDKMRYVVSQKSSRYKWQVMPKIVKNNDSFLRQESLKKAKENLLKEVKEFVQNI